MAGPLGIQLHLPATITPDHPGQPAADGATTTPPTNIEPTTSATANTEGAL